MQDIDILIQTRRLFHGAVATLPDELYWTIPDGFANNIAWNIGHTVVVQQRLHYSLSGLPLAVSEEEMAMFMPGTSPADWESRPDLDRLLGLLVDLPQRLQADYAAGRFVNFRPYTSSTTIQLNSIEESIAFNNFHEGLHLGTILCLRDVIRQSKPA